MENKVARRRRVRVAIVAGVCWLVANTALAGLCPRPDLEGFYSSKLRSSAGLGVDGKGSASAEMPCHSAPEPRHASQPQAPSPHRSCCGAMHAPAEMVSPALVGPSVTVTLAPACGAWSSRFPVRWVDLHSQHLLVHDPPLYIRSSSLLI